MLIINDNVSKIALSLQNTRNCFLSVSIYTGYYSGMPLEKAVKGFFTAKTTVEGNI